MWYRLIGALRNGVLIGLPIGLTVELINTWVVWTYKLSEGLSYGYGLHIGLSDGLSVGGLQAELFAVVVSGLLAGLLTGGLACLRHGILRWLLWRAGSIPWSYPRFLDTRRSVCCCARWEGATSSRIACC